MPKQILPYTIHQMPENERPRERLKQYGPEAISSAELIAIILGSGTKGCSVLQMAQDLLVRFGSLQNFAEASLEELQQVKGLGIAKAIQLKAALSLGIRASKQTIFHKFKILHPLHAYHYIKDELEHENRELVIVLLQDSKGGVLSHQVISIGTFSQALVHPREVFRPAIRHHAASLVLVHNHPSGDPTPSNEDIEVTRILIEAGYLMDIPLNDHLVVGHGSYVSLRQEFRDLWKMASR